VFVTDPTLFIVSSIQQLVAVSSTTGLAQQVYILFFEDTPDAVLTYKPIAPDTPESGHPIT